MAGRPAASQQRSLSETPGDAQTGKQSVQAGVPADWQQVGRPQPASAAALLQEASKSRADVTGEAPCASMPGGEIHTAAAAAAPATRRHPPPSPAQTDCPPCRRGTPMPGMRAGVQGHAEVCATPERCPRRAQLSHAAPAAAAAACRRWRQRRQCVARPAGRSAAWGPAAQGCTSFQRFCRCSSTAAEAAGTAAAGTAAGAGAWCCSPGSQCGRRDGGTGAAPRHAGQGGQA